MSDESPYRPIQFTVPGGHPLTSTKGFTDIFAQFYATLTPVKPVEPIKLTREQLDEVRATVKPAPAGMVPPPILGTPIVIVERVEDSTPYQRRMEELKRAAEAAMKISYPTYTDAFFDPSLIRDDRRKR